MMTVKEVCEKTGVSARTLRWYHKTGLLVPKEATAAGYRLYDDSSLERLQTILLFRELEFSLDEIRTMLDAPDFDRKKALSDQKKLLQLKKERLEGLILLVEKLEQGEEKMKFDAFDTETIEAYKQEAKERWGNTEAWRQSEGKETTKETADGMMEIFARFGAIRTDAPEGAAAQSLVAELQAFITKNYYDCKKEILKNLGELYVLDGRFRENIDRAGGEGTAEFVNRAIEIYCK